MNTIITFIFVLMLAAEPLVYGEVTQKEIDREIVRSTLIHPYLFFSEKDKSEIYERVRNNPDLKKIMNEQMTAADGLLDASPSRNVRAARTLAFAYQMTGDEKYAGKAFEYADLVCSMDTWMVSNAHKFPIIYDRVWPWGAADDQVVFDFDITASTITFDMAIVYDWLYPALTRYQRDRIRGALLEKAITRVRGNYEYYWWAWAYRCNWCAWGNSGLGIAAIALLTEDPQLTNVIAESYNRISRYLDEIRDGCTQEGTSYLTTAMEYALNFADVLNRITDKKFNLYKHYRIKDVVKTYSYCHVPVKRSINMGESGGGGLATYNILNKIMLETSDQQAAWLRRHHHEDKPSGMFDLFWPRSTIEPALPGQTSYHFRALNWVIMRSDFTDPEKVFVACKSGLNDDPHHGHLDAGQFILFWRSVRFIDDCGTTEYGPRDFTEDRWKSPIVSSLGHNVVHVNGEQQIPCKLKDKSWDMNVGGKVLEFRTGDDYDYTLMDPAHAYPGKELKGWRRHIVLDKPVVTVVLDEVLCEKEAEIRVRFHSLIEGKIRDGYVMLKHEKGTMVIIPVVNEDYTIMSGEKSIRTHRHFETVVVAQKEKTIIGSIILPVNSEDEASKIANSVKQEMDRSGNRLISLTIDGTRYSYAYKKVKDGLLFEGKL